jgi:SSS family solute:Na+ symporter
VFAGFLKILPVFILVLPGVAAAAMQLDVRGPDNVPDYNRTYSVLVQTLLPTGVKGIVLAALLAALMSSISSMFNSASTLVARDLVARFRPATPARTQIAIGQVALVLVMVGGILTTPLIGKYRHLWDYLQEISAYLSVPFAVVGLSGIFLRRVNRLGALAAIVVGIFSSGVLLADSHIRGGLFDFLRHPYLASFLHRSFLCAVLSFAALLVVSWATPPPPEEVRAGTFSVFWRKGEGESGRDLRIAAIWMGCLFLVVSALWWSFR